MRVFLSPSVVSLGIPTCNLNMDESGLERLLLLLELEFKKDEARFKEKMGEAVGLLYINISTVGAVATMRGATGLLLQREDSGQRWGKPQPVKFGGFGFGLEAGVQYTEAVYCFSCKKGLEAFLQKTLSGKLWSFKGSWSFGPFGYTREKVLEKSKETKQPAMSTLYCHSTGMSAGVSFMLSGVELNQEEGECPGGCKATEFSALLDKLS